MAVLGELLMPRDSYKEVAEERLNKSLSENRSEAAVAYALQAQAAATLALVESIDESVDKLDLHNIMAQIQVWLNRHM